MKQSILWSSVAIGGVLLLFLAGFLGGIFICPGSYPNSKFYSFNATESQLKTAIRQVKDEFPDVCPPSALHDGFLDGQHKYWYFVYFSDPYYQTIFMTWTRPVSRDTIQGIARPERVTFAFCSYQERTGAGWKDVCDLCGMREYKPIVQRFEATILSRIIKKLGVPAS